MKYKGASMKKVLLPWLFVVIFAGIVSAASDQVYVGWGSYDDASTDTRNYALNVSSMSISTMSAVNYGVQRIICNNGTATVYEVKMVTNNTTLTTIGQPLTASEKYVEDKWFGVIYLQTIAGSAAQNIRVEELKKAN